MCTSVAVTRDGWLHGVCAGACRLVPPHCGVSLSLFYNYLIWEDVRRGVRVMIMRMGAAAPGQHQKHLT